MMTTTAIAPDDPLTRAFEGSSHVWVLVLLGVVVVALGVIVLVAGHRLPGRTGRHGAERLESR